MKEKNKIILFVAAVAVLFIGIFVFAKPNQNGAGEKKTDSVAVLPISALETSETLHDFGAISMRNGNVSKTFKVSNSSNQDVVLEKLTTSCMCTVAYIVKQDGSKKGPFGMPGHGGAASKANEIIKAGETRDIEVVYDPNAHGPAGVGRIDRFIYLEDASGNRLQLEIKANVTP